MDEGSLQTPAPLQGRAGQHQCAPHPHPSRQSPRPPRRDSHGSFTSKQDADTNSATPCSGSQQFSFTSAYGDVGHKMQRFLVSPWGLAGSCPACGSSGGGQNVYQRDTAVTQGSKCNTRQQLTGWVRQWSLRHQNENLPTLVKTGGKYLGITTGSPTG